MVSSMLFKGCGHQGGEAHKVDVLFPDSLHYGLHGNIAAQVDDLKAIVFKDDLDNVLADVVDIALDGGQHDAAFAGPGAAPLGNGGLDLVKKRSGPRWRPAAAAAGRASLSRT